MKENTKKETVLVTGGMGFIGSHVVERLVRTGYNVVVVDNRIKGRLLHAPGKSVIYHNIDVRYMPLERYDHIVHLAAWSNVRESMELPLRLYEANVMASAHIADMALRTQLTLKSIVFASSSAVVKPESHYGVSKLASEEMFNVLNTQIDANMACLRFANVYGPRQNPVHGTLISNFVQCALHEDNPEIYGDGTQSRDYVYVEDMAFAIQACIQNSLHGVMNVSTGLSLTINQVYQRAKDAAAGANLRLPEAIYMDSKAGDKERVNMAPAKELIEVGWRPETDFTMGIARQISWAHHMEGTWDNDHYLGGTLAEKSPEEQ